MAAPPNDTRDRIAQAAGELFRRQGYSATGLQQIAAASQARIGSIYHFFPNKDALAEAVIRAGGAAYGAMVLALLEHGPDDPVEALGAAFARAADDLAATGYADACPIATIALEVASTNEPLRRATAEVFTAWTDGLAAWCARFVADPEGARDLATAILTSLEGAFMLSRALRDPGPLLAAGRSVTRLATAMRTDPAGTPP
ncbi:TetR/AcrR family transcriptional regulator [Actinomadura macrotermitis]|uniref:Putative HTH-type transcriptional regulator YxaF n=1 Tax=Actinomadura macrotermitis TaxID=2585200 RepID=A0A7K0BZG8_9ACTN|nr:TetR/AcrR family transcriptional regulator [Actinomadura macrotermitis]MQY06578.1 putative HTH-type transcriptional regulator YxaF [Actinomadura macrotermitis]